MKNVVYVSGSHGSGKSTLIKKIAEKDPQLFFVYQKLVLPQKFQDVQDVSRRGKIRLARYYLHAHHLNKLSKENPYKVFLCDRCSHDCHAYRKGFLDIGWVSKKEFEDYLCIHNILITKELEPKNIIFLNPPLEDVIKNIKKRWKETGKKKWREDNFDYLIAIRKSLEEIYSRLDANILEIKFMDLEMRVSKSYSWIKNFVD